MKKTVLEPITISRTKVKNEVKVPNLFWQLFKELEANRLLDRLGAASAEM